MSAAFWDWSIEAYAQDGVAPDLIDLQDRFALNVNVLLWCVWCAARFAEIPELVLRKAADLSVHWTRDVTAPLRAARRALKAPPRQVSGADADALRDQVQATELRAEKIEQEMLVTLAEESLHRVDTIADAATRARRNLARYVSLSGAPRQPGFSMLPLDRLVDRLVGGATNTDLRDGR